MGAGFCADPNCMCSAAAGLGAFLKCATPAAGFYLDADTTPAACTSQDNCNTDAATCSAELTDKLACTVADPAGFYLVANGVDATVDKVAGPCTADQANCLAGALNHETTCSTDVAQAGKLECKNPADGFFLDIKKTPTACTSQVGCATDTANTCTTGDDVTKLKCTCSFEIRQILKFRIRS